MNRHKLRPFALAAVFLLLPVVTLSQPNKIKLPKKARGADAAAVLGKNLPEVARAHQMAAKDLEAALRHDRDLWVTEDADLVFVCEGLRATVASTTPAAPSGVIPIGADAFRLHSLPGARRVIYLDFTGHVTSGTSWNTAFANGQDIISAPFDLDGDPTTWSAAEQAAIIRVWQQVAEDYMPFAIDITTEDPGRDALEKSGLDDTTFGVRVVISPTSNWYPGAGGVAYVGSFGRQVDTPCFVFTENVSNEPKYIAEAASHEAGHTLGLLHKGLTDGTVYYEGQGDWAPIMGVSYYRPITQWSKGEYAQANNLDDELAKIAAYGADPINDDHGDTMATAEVLTGNSFIAAGVINSGADVDMFRFDVGPGRLLLTVESTSVQPNVNLRAELLDSTGAVLGTSDETGTLSAHLSVNVAGGTYYLRIDGVGEGDPATTGYSDYGSLGEYKVTGNLNGPAAAIMATPTSGNVPLTVSLSSSNSSDPNGAIVSRTWSFGDGTPDINSEATTHTYTKPGVYTISLTVTDNDNLVDVATTNVTVLNAQPVANGTISARNPDLGAIVMFSSAGSYDPDGVIVRYDWDFGDGSHATTPDATHAYGSIGNYLITLRVFDEYGSIGYYYFSLTSGNRLPVANASASPSLPDLGVPVSFSSAGSYDPDGQIVRYEWDFGDGTKSTEPNPVHAYSTVGNYFITLSVFDNYDSRGFAYLSLTAGNKPPVAAISVNTTTPPTGSAVIFTGSGSYDPDGTIVKYEWDFGDGTKSIEPNPSHSFATQGTKLVWLWVTDDHGARDTELVVLTVGTPPVAVASYSPQSPATGEPIMFSSVGTHDPDGTVARYEWDFGDGTTSAEPNPVHTYATAQSYLVWLRIWDDGGLYANDLISLTVKSPNLPPVAVASYSPTNPIAGTSTSFSSAGSTDPDGTITQYLWSFGDGTSANTANATHTYTKSGTYTVTLQVTDNGGRTASTVLTVRVAPASVDVSAYTLTSAKVTGGYAATATVKISNQLGAAQANVTVLITWSGAVSGQTQGVTDANGYVTLKSPTSAKRGSITGVISIPTTASYVHTDSLYSVALSNTVKF
jgi:PKD repeat protein